MRGQVWGQGPDAEPWEVYTVLADAPVMHKVPSAAGESACCGGTAATTETACCAGSDDVVAADSTPTRCC